jgi:hypothetical protein
MSTQSIALLAVAAALAASCASERSAGVGASASIDCDPMLTESARMQCLNNERAEARVIGRAAGAPGSTGSGHGTHAADANVSFGPR